MLEIKNIKQNIIELPDEVYNTYPILDTLGRVQNTTIVSEGGLYRLVFKSRKPEARNPWHRGAFFKSTSCAGTGVRQRSPTIHYD